ncbi:hypothetical protein Bca101_100534 [Brassica carinata]
MFLNSSSIHLFSSRLEIRYQSSSIFHSNHRLCLRTQPPIDDNSGKAQKIYERLFSDHQRDADLSKSL